MSATVIVDEFCAANVYVRSMRILCAHAGCINDAEVMIARGVPLDHAMIGLAEKVRASRIATLSEGHNHAVVSVYVH